MFILERRRVSPESRFKIGVGITAPICGFDIGCVPFISEQSEIYGAEKYRGHAKRRLNCE